VGATPSPRARYLALVEDGLFAESQILVEDGIFAES
jgi:hypothetical protein